MKLGTAIFTAILVGIFAFGAGMLSGWDSGIRDGKHLYSCEIGE